MNIPTNWEMKCWPEFFNEIVAGKKTHDLRRSTDRDFKVGDTVTLKEFDPKKQAYTGRESKVQITYITSQMSPCAYSEEALKPGFCILSIRLMSE